MAAAVLDMDSSSFDWANHTFLALNEADLDGPPAKWSAYPPPQSSLPPAAFTFPPSLLSESSVERFGQVTPPGELSPAEPQPDLPMPDCSTPAEPSRTDALWSTEQDVRSLADYQPPSPPQQHQQRQQEQLEPRQQKQEDASPGRAATKPRRASAHAPANQSPADPASRQRASPANPNPQPPKRKRGRPKSQPQTVDAYAPDGFPFQVSSARQTHLEKNRVAAHKCRQRKKEYINSLEYRAREGSNKNKVLRDQVAMLRDEVLTLKNEVLAHAGCGNWAVDQYLARCAGDLLGMQNPSDSFTPAIRPESPTLSAPGESPPHHGTTASHDEGDDDDFGLDLLRDMDDPMDDSDQ